MLECSKQNIRSWSMLGANGSFGVAATELGRTCEKLVVCTSDLLYFSGLERFSKCHPDKFYNFGIAEQNALGICAGLAKEGFNVFCVNYATFATTRALDQFRVNLSYMRLGVKVVGCAAGVSIGVLGPTHVSVEDLAISRALPNVTVLSPADGLATVKMTFLAASLPGPVYLRLTGGMNMPVVYNSDADFIVGKANLVRHGNDVGIIATGSMVAVSLQAAELLSRSGVECTVVDMHTIKPIDATEVLGLRRCRLIVCVEEHSVLGGLGGAVAEVLASVGGGPPLLRLGFDDRFEHAGDYSFLLEQYGLTADGVCQRIAIFLGEL